MRWFDIYGSVARRFRGTCKVPIRVGDIQGDFECVQLNDGRIHLRVQAADPPRTGTFDIHEFTTTGEIVGITSAGEPFRAKARFATNVQQRIGAESAPPTLRYMVTEATVGSLEAASTKRRYGLTNMTFTPNKQKPRRSSLLTFMAFENEQRAPILVKRVPHYREIESSLRAQQGCAVTCIAETKGDEEDLDWLCHILSLAQGNVINWIWREDYISRKRVRITLANRVTRPYSTIHPLPIDQPGLVPQFVATVHERFVEVFEPFRLNAVIRLLSEARYGRDSDLETRGIMLVTILELLAAAYGRAAGIHRRMPKSGFERGRRIWKPQLRDALFQAYPGRNDIPQMLDFVTSGLNRTSFSERLLTMAREFNLPTTDMLLGEQVKQVVRIRNNLIHEARFPSAEGERIVDHFFFLMAFVDRLILKFLGYSGKYMAVKGGRFTAHDLR